MVDGGWWKVKKKNKFEHSAFWKVWPYKNHPRDLQFCHYFLCPPPFVWGFSCKLEGRDLPVGTKNGGGWADLAVFGGAKNRFFSAKTYDTICQIRKCAATHIWFI